MLRLARPLPLALALCLMPPLAACPIEPPAHSTAEEAGDEGAGERGQATDEAPEELFEVLRVVDGDTIHIQRKGKKEKLRLLSVDTEERMRGGDFNPSKPETVFGEECAKWAIRFFRDLADEDGKTRVGVRFPEGKEAYDVYGRLLCHVILADGRDFNLLLVQLGKSPYFNKYGNSLICHEAFLEAQRKARAEELGIWHPQTNEPKTPGAQAAKRNYDELLPWWDALAQAVDGFRKRARENPDAVLASEDADGIDAALNAKREVEIFGRVYRTFEESNGDLTVLFRANEGDPGVRAIVPRKLRKELLAELDLEATSRGMRQNYVSVTGPLRKGRRGPELRTSSVEQWRLGGPEPAAKTPAEAGAPR